MYLLNSWTSETELNFQPKISRSPSDHRRLKNINRNWWETFLFGTGFLFTLIGECWKQQRGKRYRAAIFGCFACFSILFLEKNFCKRAVDIWRKLSISFLKTKRFSRRLQNTWCLCCWLLEPNERAVEFVDKLRELWTNSCKRRCFPSSKDSRLSCRCHRRCCHKLRLHLLQRKEMENLQLLLARWSSSLWLKMKIRLNRKRAFQHLFRNLLSAGDLNFNVIVASVFLLSLQIPFWQFETETSSALSWRKPKEIQSKIFYSSCWSSFAVKKFICLSRRESTNLT